MFKLVIYIFLVLFSLCNCEEHISNTILLKSENEETLNFENQEGNTSMNELNATELNTNLTINHTVQSADEIINKTRKYVKCLPGLGTSTVQLANDTELIKLLQADPKVTDRDVPGLCVVVLFYSKYCPFSSMAAPYYNALPRAFPDIKMVAINAMMYHLFNTQNGIVGVPSLMLFHSGRPIAKFNDSEYTLEMFSKFISKYTGLTAMEKSIVTSADFAGPVVSSPSKESDVFLIMSWLFIIICSGYYFTKSKWWTWIIEAVQSNWRESEAHANHDHID
ncbi:thioredoxin domain-containing protein 15 [Anoplophora glabripennis]|uniref:thioredoxin domain-containing protein 15 n=1 Tax=Anoplophora glabripennis TaxID=217634 RepID=UPI0008747485|nr:thioredoxin domain-containing protein 15 [Anoplophora glabripennis]